MFPNTDLLSSSDINTIADANRAQWDAFMETWREELRQIMFLLVTGAITLALWRERMLAHIRLAYVTAITLANRGVRILTPEDVTEIDQRVSEQEVFLDRWTGEMEQRSGGADAVALTFAGLTLAFLMSRGMLYGNGAQVIMERTFHSAIRLPPMPAYPRDGKTVCMSHCKCRPWRIVKLQGNGNWNCWWRLGDAEHCKTCLARRRLWSPLRIRGGEFITRVSGGDVFER